jgi:hypothetical protein
MSADDFGTYDRGFDYDFAGAKLFRRFGPVGIDLDDYGAVRRVGVADHLSRTAQRQHRRNPDQQARHAHSATEVVPFYAKIAHLWEQAISVHPCLRATAFGSTKPNRHILGYENLGPNSAVRHSAFGKPESPMAGHPADERLAAVEAALLRCE